MEIKVLTKEHYLQSMKLSEYAFQYNVPESDIPKRLETLNKHRLLGIFEGNELASKLHILSLKVLLGETEWKMGGIAGVATYPEYRRKGYVNALIKKALADMNQDGSIVSFLHPFQIDFYRRFGWEIISDNRKVTVEKINLRPVEIQPGKIKRHTEKGHTSDIEMVYRQYAGMHSGMLARDSDWWNSSVYGSQFAAVYYDSENEAAGYLLYEVKDNIMKVEEYVSLTNEARKGLWNFICQHDSMVDQVELMLSVHDPFPYYLKEPKLKTEISPYFMGRIVNATKALSSYPFLNSDSDRKLFIHLDDSAAPWNTGAYLISREGIKFYPVKEGGSCVREPKRGLHMSINSLTAVLFGYKRPKELFELELIKGDLEAVEQLEKITPPFKPFFYDFF
ncbi:GNAT family N-acetyltransferase [Bacillus sp. ISL-35]|uniref:GNAT family N-acetyltransferase n=1 Tax=Bacillus sp. ISL-35 TaxID=2819122 RepID=UPI001BE78162|nr:GNAT family N-acetyltransferase [Bacillus sp. ISL-35]MBT2678439.1 GNAT family N-acetyltransferase [Bacillus sp. ISL-35]MBT2701688.1 GNAT family N-acetyltransferase [Chryseobacterium sp. ISL-80]